MLAGAQDNELDHGPRNGGAVVERFCALTRTLKSADEMIRFVVAPDGAAVPDIKRKLPGRGIWITATRAALEDSVKRNIFARGFKKDVRVAADLPAVTERLLERSALDALAIAGKAGIAVCGFSKVAAAIGREPVVCIIQAADASDDGKRKISQVLRRQSDAQRSEIAVIGLFPTAQLDLALGRLNVVHAALLAGPASGTFLARSMRLQRFRNGFSDDATPRTAPDAPRTNE
jgi:predicted RNA-binding protein YlxR (DUF448 family)